MDKLTKILDISILGIAAAMGIMGHADYATAGIAIFLSSQVFMKDK